MPRKIELNKLIGILIFYIISNQYYHIECKELNKSHCKKLDESSNNLINNYKKTKNIADLTILFGFENIECKVIGISLLDRLYSNKGIYNGINADLLLFQKNNKYELLVVYLNEDLTFLDLSNKKKDLKKLLVRGYEYINFPLKKYKCGGSFPYLKNKKQYKFFSDSFFSDDGFAIAIAEINSYENKQNEIIIYSKQEEANKKLTKTLIFKKIEYIIEKLRFPYAQSSRFVIVSEWDVIGFKIVNIKENKVLKLYFDPTKTVNLADELSLKELEKYFSSIEYYGIEYIDNKNKIFENVGYTFY